MQQLPAGLQHARSPLFPCFPDGFPEWQEISANLIDWGLPADPDPRAQTSLVFADLFHRHCGGACARRIQSQGRTRWLH